MNSIFSKISNKTVRKHEKYYKRYPSKYGLLIKTNRGYFIDGVNVDQRSVDLFFSLRKG